MTVEPLAAAISRKVFGIWARKGDPTKAEGTWHVVHGTGKFAGWSIDSKWTPVSNFGQVGGAGAVNGCNHDWGTHSSKLRAPHPLRSEPSTAAQWF
jgi:hypothetical protein